MKITEILVESQQLDEGPLLNKIGAGIGKAAGTVAKGVGAVAGGVAGLGSALKKGYQAGKSTVGAAGDEPETDPATNAPVATTKPAAGGGTASAATTKPAAGGGTASAATTKPAAAPAAGGGTAPAPAAAQGGSAPAAGGGTAPAAAAGGTVYSQIKANLDKLDKKGKQRILATLQKEIGAAPAKTPAADPGAGAMGAMAGQLAKGGAAKPNTMANAPVSKTNAAKPGNPNAATPAAEPEAPAAGGGAFKQMAQGLGKKPAAEPTAPAAEPAAPEKVASGATTSAPSGEKTIDNPVATVGTKRATNIGKPTFDTQTGKALPGQSINAIRKKAEYGTGALGAARKRIKAGAAPAAQESIDADRRNIMGTSKQTKAREKVSESFSLFRKR